MWFQLKSVHNFEQATAALYLMQSVYAAMGNYDGKHAFIIPFLIDTVMLWLVKPRVLCKNHIFTLVRSG
jgi:hypothetical protein